VTGLTLDRSFASNIVMKMRRQVSSKGVAPTTGSGRNIGGATALKLAGEDAHIAVNARTDQAEADAVAREVAQSRIEDSVRPAGRSRPSEFVETVNRQPPHIGLTVKSNGNLQVSARASAVVGRNSSFNIAGTCSCNVIDQMRRTELAGGPDLAAQ